MIDDEDDLDVIEIAGPALGWTDEDPVRVNRSDYKEARTKARCSEKGKKTTLCWAYARGQCPFGSSCKFEHPNETERETLVRAS